MNKTNEAEAVSAALSRAQRKARITQRDIAKRFGVSAPLVTGWLNGSVRIPDMVLLQLVELFDIDPIMVRPSLAGYYTDEIMERLYGNQYPAGIIGLAQKLTSEQLQTVIDLMRVMASQNDASGDR